MKGLLRILASFALIPALLNAVPIDNVEDDEDFDGTFLILANQHPAPVPAAVPVAAVLPLAATAGLALPVITLPALAPGAQGSFLNGFVYEGCYADQTNHVFPFSVDLTKVSGMDVTSTCQAVAKKNRAFYFALQQTTCYYGPQTIKFAMYGKNVGCATFCGTGKDAVGFPGYPICGGTFANSVYQV